MSLPMSGPCGVKFWIIVDNPKETHQLSNLCEKYDGKFAYEHYDTQVLVHPKKLGANAARNSGMMRIPADWIALLDDDITPSEDILDPHLSATFRYPDAAGFARFTEFPKAVSWTEGIADFWCSHFLQDRCPCDGTQVPRKVTPNLHVKGRTNDRIMFGKDYSKAGPGEDVDFRFRLNRDGHGIVAVPRAVVHHPWVGKYAFDAVRHVMKLVTDDSMLQ